MPKNSHPPHQSAEPLPAYRAPSDGGCQPTTGQVADDRINRSIEELHHACRVYTKTNTVGRILDAVGWRADADLSASRLLDPAAGNGEFVVQACVRLIESCRAHGVTPTIRNLRSRITAIELHQGAAAESRRRLHSTLRLTGIHPSTASACATAWIHNADFLLWDTPVPNYTHVVGNPPYLRWSKIPSPLKSAYDRLLPPYLTRGDLFLPFLDRSFQLAESGGKCGFLCSDRWLYMAFAERFRTKWLPWLDIHSNDSVDAAEVFDRPVDAYPAILIASKRRRPRDSDSRPVPSRLRTLRELEYTIRVGPALGYASAFVIRPGETKVEPEILSPWIHSSEIREGSVDWSGRHVITMFDDNGDLLDLDRFPRLKARLTKFRSQLASRHIVRRGAPWYRTIDRIRALDWQRPKLLIPELAKTPRVVVDRSGAVPSHGVYAIFAPDDAVDDLYDALRDGGLARALDGRAPKLKGNYTRCYKLFLSSIPLPLTQHGR